MKQKLLKSMLLLCILVLGGASNLWATDPVTLASWTFTSGSKPANKTDFVATGGSCTSSTFYLNGSGSTWNNSKGYAFTEVTDITITLKTTVALPAGTELSFSADIFYNKASNAPMTGFTLTASENGGSYSTSGLDVTSLSLSNSSTTKTCVYTLQSALAVNETVAIKYTQTGKAGSGQGYFNNIAIKYTPATPSGTTASPTISGDTPFLGSTTVTISNAASADGASIYYTLNGDEPTTTTSENCFAYSAPFEVSATTTVKAIAKKPSDANASSVVSKTFTKVTPITVSAALTAIEKLGNNGTIADQCVSGIVCTAGSLNSGAITYYISADGTETNRLQVYKGKGLNNTDFESAGDIAVGDEVVIYGTLKNYGGNTPEFDQGSYLLSKVGKPAPTFSLDVTEKSLGAYGHETVDVTLTTNTDGLISCESDDEDVATVALKSGNVYTITAKTEGTATITISSAASATYKPASATVEITVTDNRTDAGISFAKDAEEITWGESFIGQALTNDNSVAVEWSSTNEDVATVDNTGAVTVLKAGTTEIKATFAGNATYKAVVASYTLTVNKANAGLSYTTTSFDIMLNDDTFEAPVLNNPNGLTVTYTSSNTDVATVNATTGELSYIASAVGTAMITATFVANDWYKSGSANYTINIIDPTVKGTKYNPYTVAEVIDGTATGSGIYVKGFIVGEYVGKTTNPRTSSFTTDANIAIADAFVTSPTAGGSIPVALPTDALKAAWGCKTSSGALLGYEVILKGNKDSYFSVNGIKSTSEVSAVSVPATLNADGYATFASSYPLDFTNSNIKAYIATSPSGSSVNLSAVNKVPANTGVVLNYSGEITENIPVFDGTGADDVDGNCLLVSDGTVKGGTGIYALANKNHGVGFYLVNSSVTIPKGKAYLQTGANTKEFLIFDFSDDETGINTVNGSELMVNGSIYNLSGQRISKLQKGVNIVNGKKVLF